MSILFENLSFAYFEDGENIITDFCASFDRDKISVITGRSGAGKSTLLFLASGLYPSNAGIIRSGKVTAEGKNPSELSPSEKSRTVGVMFQNPDLQFCTDTVRNELIFCLENIGTRVSDFEKIIKESLDFCEISHLENRQLGSLSGGEKQKTALACLYAIGPEWLLLDEPFANIDTASALIIAQKLRELHEKRGIGILCVDHRLDYWRDIADELFLFENGQLKKCDFPNDFGYCPNIPPFKSGECVLSLDGVSVSYGKNEVLKNITASFRRGEICAVVGDSGCGKSSLFSAIAGTVKHKGKMTFKKGRKTKVGIVTQNPQDQFVADTVKKEIMVCLKKDVNAEEKAKEILKGIGLWRYRDVSQYMLSQGQQRRLGTASLSAYECDLLLCDEPTYAQDRENTVRIMDSLCLLAREKGIAMLFSTHDTALATAYADRIFEIKDGEMHEKTKSRT